MKLTPRLVSRNVAMNPVARALARAKLLRSMTDVKIALYGTEEGAEVQSISQEVSRLIVITMLACKIDKVTMHMDLMDLALVHLCEIAKDDFKWRKSASFIVDDALDAVILVTPKLSPIALHEATKELKRLESCAS